MIFVSRVPQLLNGAMLLLLLTACGATTPTSPASGSNIASGSTPLKVVVTTSIIADLVQTVGGERVSVKPLLPPGTDPHTYSPAPADVQAVSEATLLFENGLGLEEWLDELTGNAGGSRTTVVVSEGLTPLEGAAHEDETSHESGEAAHDEDHANEDDPHMWFDIQNTIRYVENIRNGLKQADPDGSATYDANAAAYIEHLKQLDAEIVKQLETVPPERRKLVTNHDNFGYFARRYGFEVVGNVFAGVSTEQEPSAQQIAALVRLINEQQVPAVFTENTVNPRLAEQVGNEAGVKVVTNLYTDALGEAGSAGDTYIKMMRHNVEQIVAALK